MKRGRKRKNKFTYSKFSETLEALLLNTGTTQQKLGEAIGVTRQCVSNWTMGKNEPDLLKLKKIADFFGVSVDYFTGEEKLSSTKFQEQKYSEFVAISNVFDGYKRTFAGKRNIVMTEMLRDMVAIICSSIDIVEVVRCKDCRHRNPCGNKCLRNNLRCEDFDFCSYGERSNYNDT